MDKIPVAQQHNFHQSTLCTLYILAMVLSHLHSMPKSKSSMLTDMLINKIPNHILHHIIGFLGNQNGSWQPHDVHLSIYPYKRHKCLQQPRTSSYIKFWAMATKALRAPRRRRNIGYNGLSNRWTRHTRISAAVKTCPALKYPQKLKENTSWELWTRFKWMRRPHLHLRQQQKHNRHHVRSIRVCYATLNEKTSGRTETPKLKKTM